MSETLSILVVDDYPPLAISLAEILDSKGFEVKTATSGTEALQILQDHPVDVLLTNIMMPDMNGVELIRETKKILPGITAIFMTIESADDLVQRGVKEGIKAVLDKPVDVNFLVALFSTIKGGTSNSN